MKVEELMVGDWVQVPCLIDNVEHYDAWCQVKQLRDNDLDVIGFNELRYDEIVPIPLSAEILEKIGFEYINDEYGCWLLGKIELREREPYNGLFEVEINIAKETIYIHYVHELQHVLKLCGSQKDVVL